MPHFPAPTLATCSSVFFAGDNYVKDGERKRTIGTVSFEHPRVTAAFEYLDARDQRSALPGTAPVKGNGYSIWVTPRRPRSKER